MKFETMQRVINTFLVSILILFCLSATSAQNRGVRFNHIDVEDGLSQNMIRNIIQDSRGFIWIATWNGLNRYDGYEFKVYKHIDGDPNSLRNNKILRIMEDHKGRLWVGTFGGGLSLFNREEESFINFVNKPDDSTSLSSNWIISLFEDSKNRVWIGTNHFGLSLLVENETSSGTKFRFKNFKYDENDPESISGTGVLKITEDQTGNLWFASNDGTLNKLIETNEPTGKFKFEHFHQNINSGSNIRDNSYDFITRDNIRPEIFWLVDYYAGLGWFNTQSGEFLDDYPGFDFPNEIPKDKIESILISRKGEYWFGTFTDGLFSFRPGTNNNPVENLEHLFLDPFNPYGIDASDISQLYEDNTGMIWIGTHSNGIYTHHESTKRFTGYSHNPFEKNSLLGEICLSVLEDNEGNIWIGSDFGLNKYDPVKERYTYFKSDRNSNSSIGSDIVYSLHQDRDGTIWVGTATGLSRYNSSSNSFINYNYNPNDPESISNGEIIKLFTDSKGSLWIGTWGGGLNKMIVDQKTKRVRFLHYRYDENDKSSISNNKIMSIAEGPDGRLWIGTADGGLNELLSDHFVGADGTSIKARFRNYQHDPNDPNSLSNNDVRSIHVQDDGTLWFGTFGGGLNKFIPPEKNEVPKFLHFRESDGLANDVVRGILEDDEGNLWIGTAYGLSKFDPAKNKFWNFDVSDGLETAKYEDVNYKSKKTGRLYFGGVGGVVSFLPSEITTNSYKPEIVITSFKRYNEENHTMFEENGISEKKKIVLSHTDNILNFEFSALNYLSTSKNSYSYKLEGYNNNWIQLGNKRDVTFTNLDPGEYTLLVKGSNNDGIWNETAASLDIIITPPWWRTGWAFASYIFLFVLGIFVLDRIMRRKLIKRERTKATLREAELIKKQAEELETVDRLVKVINLAEDLENLFNSLLNQTMVFIPKAEKAAVFLRDEKDDLFKVAYTAGYKVQDLEKTTFTSDELKKRYAQNSEEMEKGIYIVRNTENLYGDSKLINFSKPKSMLVMAVERENELQAFVVFDSFADEDVFDQSAARILNRFREHAISAITKAQSIKTLQEKNEEIIKTQEQLLTQQKLASLGSLTAGIAHEIKNPLNFINNFAELSTEMIEELNSAVNNKVTNNAEERKAEINDLIATLKENIERINSHGSRADSIIKGMLLHSRGSSGETTPTNINDLLDQFVKLAYHGLRAQNKDFNITIEKDYDESIEKINIIPQDISRVFLNIINNACYAANEKKSIIGNGFKPLLKVSTKKDNNNADITIWDNGDGIPESIRKNVFNPFFTTKPSGEGTGLGLSLSYDIVTKGHGGSIKVESVEGEFTKFIIRLPIK